MTSPSPDLQFGIQVGGRRSYTWRIRSGAKHPELFVERENLPPAVHLSLHASGQWHMKVRRRRVHQWTKPAEITPGYTRALAIVQPVTVAMFALPVPAGAHLLKLPADAQPTKFDVWIERPGAANLQSWPGKNADGTVLVGRIPLAGGVGTCCVVSRRTAIAPGSAALERPTEEQFTWIQERAAEGRLYCTIIGDLDDETVVLLDLRADASVSDVVEPPPAVVCLPANVRRPRPPLYMYRGQALTPPELQFLLKPAEIQRDPILTIRAVALL